MGEGIFFGCKQCGYEFSIDFGCGFFNWLFLEMDTKTNKPFYHSLIESADVIAEVDRILETEENVREDNEAYDNPRARKHKGLAAYYCQSCKTVKNNYFFRLIFTGGSYEPVYFCEKCKSELLLARYKMSDSDSGFRSAISDKPLDVCCPRCGSDNIRECGYIDWD